MTDIRMNLLRSLENTLLDYVKPDVANEISNKIIMILGDYEITERCTDIVPKDTTNDKLIKLFCGSLMVDGKSENTIYQYRRIIKNLCNFVCKQIPEIGVYDIRFFLASEKERGISDRSIENYRSYLSSFFAWLTNEELIQKNPMRTIKPITYNDEIRMPFTDVEIDKLRSACRTIKERAIIEFLLATGVRVSELSQMEVKDVIASEYRVMVEHGKGGNKRKTYITPVAMAHLEKYLDTRPEKEGTALFYNRDHEVMTSGCFRYMLRKLSKRSGVKDVHPHRFRRTFACILAKRGMDIREIQKLLGHKNINTTMIYVNTDDEQVKASYRKYIS